jgi:FeS assembly SUF system protein
MQAMEPNPPAPQPPPDPIDRAAIERDVILALQTVFDPEIPVNIHELGLIYGIDVADDGGVVVRMTLTAPACPAAGMLPDEVASKVRTVAGVTDSRVELVWDPPWTPDKMSEAAKLTLGFL